VPQLAVVGNLSLDLVNGRPPRVGGAPFHAARALRVLGRPALILAKCAHEDRPTLLPPLIGLGLPVVWLGGASTAGFSFQYDGDRRAMTVDSLGDAWTPEDAREVGEARWVHVGALAQSDFPLETLAELSRRRRVSFDGQGLVRPPRTGPLELDDGFDRELLRHISVLKLAEEEAGVVVGGAPDEEGLSSLGVPEVLVTLGSQGSLLLADGRLQQIPAAPIEEEIDPTGAGDAFAAGYLVARSAGHAPAAAARRATSVVAGLLGRRLR
jgi:sugar/nucleoside kinase (ribokinase family)